MSEIEGSQDSLRISRVFPATRQRTFRAWTDPNELKKWWRVGKNFILTVAEIDLRVGGGFRIGVESPSGSIHMVRGRFLEVVPPERLVYTWIAEDPNLKQMETLVTVEFLERGDATEISLLHEKLKDGGLRESTRFGWASVIDGLATLLRSNS